MAKNKRLEIESRKKRAYELHAEITEASKNFGESIVRIGSALKQIRDEKYYKELGYDSFESYTETEWRMSVRNAERYVEVIEKLPKQIATRVSPFSTEIPSLRRLIALPFDDSKAFEKAINEEQLTELARMSDPEFQTALDAMKKDRDGWQARYQKVWRENKLKDEKIATFKAEMDAAYKQLDDANREIATLKIGESNEKVLKLTQERDNALAKIQDIGNRLHELEAKELKGEQAFAAIREHTTTIITEIMELLRIKLEPEFLPFMWSQYLMIKTLISGQLAYILDKMEVDPEQGEGWLYTLAKTIDPSLMDRPFTKEEYQKLKAEGKLPLQVFPKFDKDEKEKIEKSLGEKPVKPNVSDPDDTKTDAKE